MFTSLFTPKPIVHSDCSHLRKPVKRAIARRPDVTSVPPCSLEVQETRLCGAMLPALAPPVSRGRKLKKQSAERVL